MLKQIIAARKRSLDEEKKKHPLSPSPEQPAVAKRSLVQALKQPGITLIAEIKQASPSKGKIREDVNVTEIAKVYEKSGAKAISVLTEPTYFQGSFSYLKLARESTSLPILAKDFIIDAYQIYRAKSEGADAVLLMAQVLSEKELKEFVQLAHALNLEVLAEASNAIELKKILPIQADIIGINSRDFHSLKINFQQAVNLLDIFKPDRPVVFESGLESRKEVELLEKKGVDGILVGTSLMASKDIAKKIAVLLGKQEEK